MPLLSLCNFDFKKSTASTVHCKLYSVQCAQLQISDPRTAVT